MHTAHLAGRRLKSLLADVRVPFLYAALVADGPQVPAQPGEWNAHVQVLTWPLDAWDGCCISLGSCICFAHAYPDALAFAALRKEARPHQRQEEVTSLRLRCCCLGV